jgi:hypothetical protein
MQENLFMELFLGMSTLHGSVKKIRIQCLPNPVSKGKENCAADTASKSRKESFHRDRLEFVSLVIVDFNLVL